MYHGTNIHKTYMNDTFLPLLSQAYPKKHFFLFWDTIPKKYLVI